MFFKLHDFSQHLFIVVKRWCSVPESKSPFGWQTSAAIVQIETAPMIPLKTAVEVPVTIVKREPIKINNCFGVEMELETLNTYEQSALLAGLPFDGALKEPLVQQQTQEQVTVGGADLTPRPNLQEKDAQQMEDSGGLTADERYERDRERIERKLDAPVWQGLPRRGPWIWWQKSKADLDAEALWHRKHPMSPAFGEAEIDSRDKRDEAVPKAPSHGRSEHWVKDSD